MSGGYIGAIDQAAEKKMVAQPGEVSGVDPEGEASLPRQLLDLITQASYAVQEARDLDAYHLLGQMEELLTRGRSG